MSEPGMMNAPTQLRRLAEQYDEPQWLKARREQAFAEFESMPVPRLEKTDISKRSWDIGTWADVVGSEDSRITQLLQASADVPLVYVRDGVVETVKLPEHLSAKGVVFASLHDAVKSHASLIQKHLGSVVADGDTKWHALNAALWNGGAFLYVPRNVTIEEQFLFVYSNNNRVGGAYPRVLVVGEESSSFSVAEVLLEASEADVATVHSEVVEIVAGPAAHITYSFVSQLRKGSTHFVTRRSLVHQDAQVDLVGGDVGDAFTVGLLESHLRGSGSRATAQFIGMGYGRQRLDLTASMVHYGRYSESDIKMYGVLRDRANSLYRSSTQIVKGAAAAGSEQSDRMLVLDNTARADAIPMLLIDENDVQRCGHAASVGKLDQNHIYYLMSRGIPETDARKMIVWGYLQPTLEAMPLESVRDLATRLIDEVLV